MSAPNEIWTDIKTGNWIDRRLPVFAKPYARLMRLDRPIGTWLLLIPCWWGVALAGPKIPDLWLMFLFTLGAIVMRGAGCVVNDIYDRKLDAQVGRTSMRPLASGEIKLWQALVFLAVLLLLGLGVLLLLNPFTVILGVASLLLIFIYPLMKRITWWPQLFLGITFNWGALMGYAAVKETLTLSPLLLYAAGVFWTLAYDTIYAHQDKEDDARAGIKSTARLFAEKSKQWIAVFYTMALIILTFMSWIEGFGTSFYWLLIFAGAFAFIQIMVWQINNPEDCRIRFCANRDFGFIILASIILGKWI